MARTDEGAVRLDGRACQWCGKMATGVVEVEPAKFGNRGGIKTLIQRAKTANACPDHAEMVTRETHLTNLRNKRTRLLRALERSSTHTQNHQDKKRQAEQIEGELRAAGDAL